MLRQTWKRRCILMVGGRLTDSTLGFSTSNFKRPCHPAPNPKTALPSSPGMKRRWRIVLIRSKSEVLGRLRPPMPRRPRRWLRSSSSWMSFSAGGCWCRSWPGEREPRPYRWPPTWFTDLLAMDRRAGASVFVIEAWVEKRWRPIARSDYEASARRLFNQASYVCPVETLLRLRRGSDVLIKMPADGRVNVRE